MSRSQNIQTILGDPELRIKAMKPSGDCFYEAVSEAFLTIKEDVRDSEKVSSESDDSPSMALRRTAACAVNEEVFSSFEMFFTAGLPDFTFMRRIRSVEDLKQRLLVSGVGAGAGQCLWANEFEIGVVCSALNVVSLILDLQTKDEKSRYVSVGCDDSENEIKPRYILLQRTRREHYNLIFSQTDTTQAVFTLEELSETVRRLWNLQ